MTYTKGLLSSFSLKDWIWKLHNFQKRISIKSSRSSKWSRSRSRSSKMIYVDPGFSYPLDNSSKALVILIGMSLHKECKKGLLGSVNSRLQRWEPPFSPPPVPTCDMHWPNQHFPTDIEYVGNAIFSKIKVLTSPKCLVKISRRPRI